MTSLNLNYCRHMGVTVTQTVGPAIRGGNRLSSRFLCLMRLCSFLRLPAQNRPLQSLYRRRQLLGADRHLGVLTTVLLEIGRQPVDIYAEPREFIRQSD
jgi:hypothetical protein